MAKSRKPKSSKKSGGGKATFTGTTFQAEIAAWIAVHLLAKCPLRQVFGIENEAIPESIRLETAHAVDDIFVRFSPQGRLFIQATTDLSLSFVGKEPPKLVKTLVQSLNTWEDHKAAQSTASFQSPLKRGVDAIIIAIPQGEPLTLENLEKVFRCFDQHSQWRDAATDRMSGPEQEALANARTVLRNAASSPISDDELVELFGLIRIVRLQVEEGGHDYQKAIELLQREVLEDPKRAQDALNLLLRNSSTLAKRAASADRAGLIRELARQNIRVKVSEPVRTAGLERSVEATQNSNGRSSTQLVDTTPAFPPEAADRELLTTLYQARQKAMFVDPAVDYLTELVHLAERAGTGDLRFAKTSLRSQAIQYAARAVSLGPKDSVLAEQLLTQAKKIEPHGHLQISEAVLLYLKDAPAAIRAMRSIDLPEARSQLFLFEKFIDPTVAIERVKASGVSPHLYNPFGVCNVLLTSIQIGDFAFALSWAEQIPDEYCEECPALYSLRAQIKVAACSPGEEASLMSGLPLDLRAVHLAEDKVSLRRRDEAMTDLQRLIKILRDLGLEKACVGTEELLLFLELEKEETAPEARIKLQNYTEHNASRAIELIRLLLSYDVPFDETRLEKELETRQRLGGWTSSEAFAALALVLKGEDPKRIVTFLADYRGEIGAANLNPEALTVLEVQALAKSGNIDGAKSLLSENGSIIRGDIYDRLAELIEEEEGNASPLENAKRHYSADKDIKGLRLICSLLSKQDDHAELAQYAIELAERSRAAAELRSAVKILCTLGRFEDILSLINKLGEVAEGDKTIEHLKAHACLATGQVNEAADILHRSFNNTVDPDILKLEISTAIERGDWEHLRGVLERVAKNSEAIEPIDLVRFAHLGQEVGSGYGQTLIQAALVRASDNPHIHLAAYNYAVQIGQEGEESFRHLQKAIELSGPDGPVEQRPLQELAEMIPGRQEYENRVNALVRDGSAPVFMAARALNVTMTNAALGRAVVNAKTGDARRKSPILAFHGEHKAVDLTATKVLALDISSILTLAYLERLEDVVSCFDSIVIGAGTLSTLFSERERIRFHQPSRIKQAQRLQDLAQRGRLQVVSSVASTPADLTKEVGGSLAALLVAAQVERGLVVRPGPIHKAGSLSGQIADLGSYSDFITDTRQVIDFLKNQGKLSAQLEATASKYINAVDNGREGAKSIVLPTRLFLDDLAVSYLDYTKTLPVLAEAAGPLLVTPELLAEAEALINHEQVSDVLLSKIEEIRRVIEAGIKSQKIVINHEVYEPAREKEDQFGRTSPTVALLRSVTPFDAIAADDRVLGKSPNWEMPFGLTVATNSIDILNALFAREAIAEEELYHLRDQLRQAAYHLIPLECDELIAALRRTPIVGGALHETPELTNIRENILLVLASGARLPSEEYWLNYTRHSIFKAIRAVWEDGFAVPEAYADWLISLYPDIQDFAPIPLDPENWRILRERAAMETALFFNGGMIPSASARAYRAWVESRIVATLQSADPSRAERAITLFKSLIESVVDESL